MNGGELLKQCRICLCFAPLSEFYVDKRSSDGHMGRCKECSKKANKKDYLNNPQRCREAKKRWRVNNPEKLREQRKREKEKRSNKPEEIKKREERERRQARNKKIKEAKSLFRSVNKEIREARAEYRRKNPEIQRMEWRDKYREYYKNNNDSVIKKVKRWKEKNPEKVKEQLDRNIARSLLRPRNMDVVIPDEMVELGLLYMNLRRKSYSKSKIKG